MATAVGLVVFLGITFARFAVANDAIAYYNFLLRLFGDEHAKTLASRGFGAPLFDVPLYGVARGFEGLGWHSALGAPLTQTAVGISSIIAGALTLYLGWKILVRLELPAGPAVLLLTLFGTPLFYYVMFQPTYKHAVDALAFTLVTYLLLRVTETPTTRLVVGLGASVAFLIVVRPANFLMTLGVLLGLALSGGHRRVPLLLAVAVAGVALLFLIPKARHIPTKGATPVVRIESKPRLQEAGLLALYGGICHDPGYKLTFAQCIRNSLGVYWRGTAPLNMLGSLKRGLFLWTPLTLLSIVGVVLLFFSRPARRPFLYGLAACAFLLLFVHLLWGDFWTGGFSFSQRFLANLFPFYLVGTAEVIRRWRGIGLAAVTACTIFSLFVGFSLFIGYKGVSAEDNIGDVLHQYLARRTPIDLARKIVHVALQRYGR